MDTVYDVIVNGGGLTGCLTAIAAAKKGYKTVLIEKKTFLGDTIVSGLMTTYRKNSMRGEFEKSDSALNALFKKQLLDSLEEYGVNILFISDLCGVAV